MLTTFIVFPLFFFLTLAGPAAPPLPLAGYLTGVGMPLFFLPAASPAAATAPAVEQAVIRTDFRSAVRLTVPERLHLYREEPVGLAFTNNGMVPLAVDTVVFRYRGKTVGSLMPGCWLDAARRSDMELVATATLFVDDPGAAARAPQPDQWRWRPGIRLRSLPVLYPGEGISLAGTVRLTDPALAANADRLTAEITAYRIDPAAAPLYQLVATNSRAVHPANLERRGLHPVRGLELVFRKPVTAANPPRLRITLDRETIGPWVIEADHLGKLAKPERIEARAGFRFEPPQPSLDEAQRRSGQSGPPSFYSYRVNAWCLPDGIVTTVVGPAFLYRIAGDPTRMLESLDRNGRVVLEITPALAPNCTAAGFPEQRTPEKGGGFRHAIVIESGNFAALLALMEREKLRLDGLLLMGHGSK